MDNSSENKLLKDDMKTSTDKDSMRFEIDSKQDFHSSEYFKRYGKSDGIVYFHIPEPK